MIYNWLFRTPLPLKRLISSVHVVGTPQISIAETVAQATLCDFQLDTILQPHCLVISAKLRKRQVKRYIKLFGIIKQMHTINEIVYAHEHFFDKGEQTAKVFQRI